MSLSLVEFAAALPGLRPQLHQMLQYRYPCSPEDGEDLVETAVCEALEKLASFNPQPSTLNPQPLLSWLKGFLLNSIRRERYRAAHCPPTVPLDLADSCPNGPMSPIGPISVSPRSVLLAKIAALPAEQSDLLGAWLDGYSQNDLSGMYRLHRNTVANRLHLAFETLGTDPDADRLTYSMSLFDKFRRQPIYHKPPGSCHRWMNSLPRDIAIVLTGNTEDRSRSDRRIRALRRVA